AAGVVHDSIHEVRLVLGLTATPNPVTSNGTILFTLTITNTGVNPANADNVQTTFTSPAGMTVLSCSTSIGVACTNNGSSITADLGTVPPNSPVVINIVDSVPNVASQTIGNASATVQTSTTQSSTAGNNAALAVTTNAISGPPSSQVVSVAVSPNSSNSLLAAANSGGVFRSGDGGAHWTQVNAGLQQGIFVRLVLYNPSSPAFVYLGTTNGVYKSSDGGFSWTRM